MLDIFLIGTVGFYIVTAIFSLVFIIVLCEETIFGLFVAGIVYTLFLQFLAGINVYDVFVSNPWYILMFLLVYIIVGVPWSFFKFYSYLNNVVKPDLLEKGRKGESFEVYLMRLKQDDSYAYKHVMGKLSLETYKNKIIRWMAFWPISVLVSLKYILKDVFTFIYDTITKKMYQKILNTVLKDFIVKLK